MPASRGQATSKRARPPFSSTQEAFSLLLAQLPDLFTTGLLHQLRLTLDLYVQTITPTEKERDAKRTLFNAFADFLRRAMHDRIAISVAGSTAYEVDAKGSDLDVVLLTNWGAPPYVLQAIVRYLQMTQAVQNSAARSTWPLKNVSLQLVDSARVPVLTVTTPKGLVCDVSVNTLNSVKHTEFFKRVISVNLALRPMMRLLKYWAKVRRLPTMREGGLPGIVWMLLAVYFGSCPQKVFLSVLDQTSLQANGGGDTHLVAELYPALETVSPLISSLFRFFRLCGTRKSLARTISCTGQYCKSKNTKDIITRVSSQQNSSGVWDEVVSVEDPAVTSEPALPANAKWVEDEAPAEGGDGEATAAPGERNSFKPGSSTDLAAKMSSATWLVYMLELRRGALIFSRLFTFIADARARVKQLPSLVSTSPIDPDGSESKSKKVNINVRPGGKLLQGVETNPSLRIGVGTSSRAASSNAHLCDPSVSAHDFVARHFRQFVAFLFEESSNDRFVLPGCDEKLRSLAADASASSGGGVVEGAESAETDSHGRSQLDVRWEAPLLSARGMSQMTFRPFCECCSHPQMDFGIVLLHTRVHLVRITSICTDWSSWWTKDFLSRRDVRSVIHGTLHEIFPPAKYLPYIIHDAEKHALVDMPPTGFPADHPCEPLPDEVTPYPHLVVPVRRAKDATPVELLFRPCDFVCRLKAWQVPDNSHVLPAPGVPDEVFFMEADETAYLQTMTSLVSAAPWFHVGDNFGATSIRSAFGQNVASQNSAAVTFQAAASGCVQCGVFGDSMEALPETATYECPQAAFQTAPLNEQKIETCRAAWRRWELHADQSASKHKKSAVVLSASPRADVFVVPELHRASHLLAATIDGLQQRLIPKQPPSSRRTVSLPDRFESKDEVAEDILRPALRAPKREELLRYVPPSKRQSKRKVAETTVTRNHAHAQDKSEDETVSVGRRRSKGRAAAPESLPENEHVNHVSVSVPVPVLEAKAVDRAPGNHVHPNQRSAKNSIKKRQGKDAHLGAASVHEKSSELHLKSIHNEHVITDASRRLLQSALKGATFRPPPPPPLARLDSAHSSRSSTSLCS